jgi:molybdopterin molybdotransferase
MGEDVSAGDIVVNEGCSLTPAAVGLCAAVGRAHVLVARRPRVGLISTGDEIVPPGQPLGPGQIYSSNTHALAGLVLSAGAIPVDCGIAPDRVSETRAAFTKASECDLIISTGGVSVGDFDVVRQAMHELGAQMQFWKVRIKPGKPLAFGVIGGTPAFGLPGNPVSCQVGFLQFVRPWLRMAMGDPSPFLPVVQATLAQPVFKRAGRAELSRVVLHHKGDGWEATLAGTQGSGNQVSMVSANGLMLLSEETTQLQKGTIVSVQVFEHALSAQTDPGYPW